MDRSGRMDRATELTTRIRTRAWARIRSNRAAIRLMAEPNGGEVISVCRRTGGFPVASAISRSSSRSRCALPRPARRRAGEAMARNIRANCPTRAGGGPAARAACPIASGQGTRNRVPQPRGRPYGRYLRRPAREHAELRGPSDDRHRGEPVELTRPQAGAQLRTPASPQVQPHIKKFVHRTRRPADRGRAKCARTLVGIRHARRGFQVHRPTCGTRAPTGTSARAQAAFERLEPPGGRSDSSRQRRLPRPAGGQRLAAQELYFGRTAGRQAGRLESQTGVPARVQRPGVAALRPGRPPSSRCARKPGVGLSATPRRAQETPAAQRQAQAG